jgi:hypothetical protein
MDSTARFSIPFLAAGQAQKEWTHNEALQRVEMLLCPAVAGSAGNVPPASPSSGTSYLVGAAPTGAWSGHANAIAGWTPGGWRFIDPVEGLSARVATTGESAVFRQGAWQIGVVDASEVRVGGEAVVRGRRPAIATPAGGSTVDSEARTAISAILASLRAHGLIAT